MATQPAAATTTDDLIGQLEALELEGLRAIWRQHFGDPPSLRSVDLMRLTLGWRLQARAAGGIGNKTRRHLRRKAREPMEGLGLGAGTLLKREWQGQVHEVIIQQTNFRWNGENFASLSAVARAITGTRWNGPRFFGLRAEK